MNINYNRKLLFLIIFNILLNYMLFVLGIVLRNSQNGESVSKRPILADLMRWAQILILEILSVFLWLKFSPALSLTKLKRFEIGSGE